MRLRSLTSKNVEFTITYIATLRSTEIVLPWHHKTISVTYLHEIWQYKQGKTLFLHVSTSSIYYIFDLRYSIRIQSEKINPENVRMLRFCSSRQVWITIYENEVQLILLSAAAAVDYSMHSDWLK